MAHMEELKVLIILGSAPFNTFFDECKQMPDIFNQVKFIEKKRNNIIHYNEYFWQVIPKG